MMKKEEILVSPLSKSPAAQQQASKPSYEKKQ